ncbi:MAG: hypothetical protein AAB443_03780 [Patescibacteria group bacterium]
MDLLITGPNRLDGRVLIKNALFVPKIGGQIQVPNSAEPVESVVTPIPVANSRRLLGGTFLVTNVESQTHGHTVTVDFP